ncbi:hypothetical protein [Tepidibacillus marianensis]|uniref:hypothetical protein n=1 Tax=Tepidibacillus marianensis TaxID=3131995 RepID=UPI0030D39ED1
MKFEISENQINNIMTFLNRVPVTGFNEIAAMNEIAGIFQNPIVENPPKEESK